MSINFPSIEKINGNLGQWADNAEEYLYTDPRSSMMSSGLINEELIKLLYKNLKIKPPKKANLHNLIYNLKEEKIISNEYYDFFSILENIHALRNESAHSKGIATTDRAITMLHGTYIIYKYFCDLCIEEEIEFNDFKLPGKPLKIIINEKKTDINRFFKKAKNDKLFQIAIENSIFMIPIIGSILGPAVINAACMGIAAKIIKQDKIKELSMSSYSKYQIPNDLLNEIKEIQKIQKND